MSDFFLVQNKITSIPDGATVTPVDDYAIWLRCAELPNKYGSLANVIADTTAMETLCNNINALRYMVRSEDVIMPAVLADSDWVAELDACAYSVKIPTLTSNTSSELGEASGTITAMTNEASAYRSFDKDTLTFADLRPGYATAMDATVIFTFEDPIYAYKTRIYAKADGAGTVATGVIATSENGSTWNTSVALSNGVNFTNSAWNTYTLNAPIVKAIKTYATSSSNGRGMLCHELELYGLDLS